MSNTLYLVRQRCGIAVNLFALLGVSCSHIPQSQNRPLDDTHAAIRLLVKPKAGVALDQLAAFHASKQAMVRRTYPAMGNLQVVEVKQDTDVSRLISEYQQSGLVEYVERDHEVTTFQRRQ